MKQANKERTYTRTHTHFSTKVAHMHTRKTENVCTHAHIHGRTHIQAHSTHKSIHTHTHAHTHTHTRTRAPEYDGPLCCCRFWHGDDYSRLCCWPPSSPSVSLLSDPADDPAGLAQYFFDTEFNEMEYECTRCKPQMVCCLPHPHLKICLRRCLLRLVVPPS
jgi:hypothetical protein